MRLLNTTTGEFETFYDPRTVRYAILSHCWPREGDPGREMEYAEMREIQTAWSDPQKPVTLRELSTKIQQACKVARSHGYTYIWIDSCCIDKTSSSELSEAINSMFTWYRCAKVCYAFLRDVPDNDHPSLPDSYFRKSEWHKRGWTLQELIAPGTVIFLSQSWNTIDTKHGLANVISEITSIDVAILTNLRPVEDVCVAERMSWAAGRLTSRVEDQAYCLAGIFGVSVSPLYGEGDFAFIRLQEAILKALPDQSIFVWGARCRSPSLECLYNPKRINSGPLLPERTTQDQAAHHTYILASSPNDFDRSPNITTISPDQLSKSLELSYLDSHRPRYDFTSYGIRTTFPVVQFSVRDRKFCLAFLACTDKAGNFLALLLRSESDPKAPSVEFSVGEQQGQGTASFPFMPVTPTSDNHVRLVIIPSQEIRGRSAEGLPRKIFHDSLFTFYVRHRTSTRSIQRASSQADPFRASIMGLKVLNKTIPTITIDQSSVAVLRSKGYHIQCSDGPLRLQTKSVSYTLSRRPAGTDLSGDIERVSVVVGLCGVQCGGAGYDCNLYAGVTGDTDGAWPLSAELSFCRQPDGSKSRWRNKTPGHPAHPVHWHVLGQWKIEGGIATQTFKSLSPRSRRSKGSVDEHLRLTLTLDGPVSYILSIDAFKYTPSLWQAAASLPPEVRHSPSSSRIVTTESSPDPVSLPTDWSSLLSASRPQEAARPPGSLDEAPILSTAPENFQATDRLCNYPTTTQRGLRHGLLVLRTRRSIKALKSSFSKHMHPDKSTS